MKATIYHNPACGTSRNALQILKDEGAEVTIVEYLKQPYTRGLLEALLQQSGMTPKDALRLRGTDASERGLDNASDDQILDAMVANPAYVNRPFVTTEKGSRFCRPAETVREIL